MSTPPSEMAESLEWEPELQARVLETGPKGREKALRSLLTPNQHSASLGLRGGGEREDLQGPADVEALRVGQLKTCAYDMVLAAREIFDEWDFRPGFRNVNCSRDIFNNHLNLACNIRIDHEILPNGAMSVWPSVRETPSDSLFSAWRIDGAVHERAHTI